VIASAVGDIRAPATLIPHRRQPEPELSPCRT
jgi:hypothetical protein